MDGEQLLNQEIRRVPDFIPTFHKGVSITAIEKNYIITGAQHNSLALVMCFVFP